MYMQKLRTHFAVTLRESNYITNALRELRYRKEREFNAIFEGMDSDEQWAYQQEIHELYQLETHILYSDDIASLPDDYIQGVA